MWLLLSYELAADVEKVETSPGTYKVKADGFQTSRMKLIDTDNGKVTEVEYRIMGGNVKERKPNFNETAQAKKILEAPAEADRVARAKIAKQEQFIKDYRRKIAALERDVADAKRAAKQATAEAKKAPAIDAQDAGLLAEALWFYRQYTFHTDQGGKFAELGRIFKDLLEEEAPLPVEDYDIEELLEEMRARFIEL
jgi:hypothetical protein